MEKAKVYFTDLRTQIGVSQLDKLEKLIRAAGRTPWSTWTAPLRTATPPTPPAARSSSPTA